MKRACVINHSIIQTPPQKNKPPSNRNITWLSSQHHCRRDMSNILICCLDNGLFPSHNSPLVHPVS